MDKYIGRLLDNRYEILEVIGTGGMAIVYKARCHRLNRLVAVKILKDEYSKDADFRRRFHAESQAVAMLSHPNIVAVYDVSKSHELEYIVMELIDGLSLKQYMQKKGALNWREALHFSSQIAKALDHAHNRGIIHRDIKPHNIMILRDGSVKVADFGIARFTSSQNTLTQEALGSVHYISPEQAKGSRVDSRSDIYSLGVVLYEMLTGKLPYDGDSPVAVAIAHINSMPVMPREINPDIPPALEEITMKAMCADIDKRYKSAAAMLADLEEFRVNQNVVFGYFGAKPSREAPAGKTTPVQGGQPPSPPVYRKEQETQKPVQRKTRPEEPAEEGKKSNKAVMVAAIAAIVIFIFGVGAFLWTFLIKDYVTPSENLTVPKLVGQDINAVKSNPEYQDFVLVESDWVYSDSAAEGIIISQSPDANLSAKKGSRIELTISSGVKNAQMPNLVNVQYQQAVLQLDGLSLNLNVSQHYEYSDTMVEGYIIRTSPEYGTTLYSGDTVTMVISQGPQVNMVVVPTLTGIDQDTALKMIEETGLVKGVISNVPNEAPEGTVIYQSLAADQQVKEGTTINLQVSSGPEPEVSPSESPEVSPSESPEVSPSAPVEYETQVKEVEIPIPDGGGEAMMLVMLDGYEVIWEIVEKNGQTIKKSITGRGVQKMDVYFDGILEYYKDVDFTS